MKDVKDFIVRHKKIFVAIVVIVLFVIVIGAGYLLRFNFITAATVEDKTITEAAINSEVDNIRKPKGITTDERWASYMRGNSLTPEKVHDNMLDQLVDEKIIDILCEQYGVTVNPSEVTKIYNYEKEQVAAGGQTTLEAALQQEGSSAAAYQKTIMSSLKAERLAKKMTEAGECNKFAEKFYAEHYPDSINGSIGYYAIICDSADSAKDYKQQIENRIKTPKEVAEIVFDNDVSHTNIGVELFSFVKNIPDEYMQKLESMNFGEVLYAEDNGYILMIPVEKVSCPVPFTSFDQINDKDLCTRLTMFYSMAQGQITKDILNDQHEKMSIEKFGMPEDAPYNVDINLGL